MCWFYFRWSSRSVHPRRAGASPLPPQRRSLPGRIYRTALQLLLLQSVLYTYWLCPPCRSLFLSVLVTAVYLSLFSVKKKFLCTDYCVHLPAVYCIMCCKNTVVSARLRLLPENQINIFIIVKVNSLKCSMLNISIHIFQGLTGLKISVTQNLAAALTSPLFSFCLLCVIGFLC